MGAELLTPTTALQAYSFCQEAWAISVWRAIRINTLLGVILLLFGNSWICPITFEGARIDSNKAVLRNLLNAERFKNCTLPRLGAEHPYNSPVLPFYNWQTFTNGLFLAVRFVWFLIPVFKGDSGICCEMGKAHYLEGGLSLSVIVVAGLFGSLSLCFPCPAWWGEELRDCSGLSNKFYGLSSTEVVLWRSFHFFPWKCRYVGYWSYTPGCKATKWMIKSFAIYVVSMKINIWRC